MNDTSDAGGRQELVVEAAEAGLRLDQFLSRHFPDFSRTQLRRVINATGALVNGARAKASHKLKPGERVSFVPGELPAEGPQPEPIPLEILYEDADLAVVNKPPGMVVHPAKGHWAGTLAAALRYHFERLSSAGGANRPGIVHRLDRDTSGVILVARHDRAHLKLAALFEARRVEKEYFAILAGTLDRDRDVIDEPIGPHPYQREKMAIRRGHPEARRAITEYEVAERFLGFTAARVRPETGRTHQIRVHLAHAGAAVLCDKLYGGRARITAAELSRDTSADRGTEEVLLDRQALHAARLRLVHPFREEMFEFQAPLPADLERVLAALRRERSLDR